MVREFGAHSPKFLTKIPRCRAHKTSLSGGIQEFTGKRKGVLGGARGVMWGEVDETRKRTRTGRGQGYCIGQHPWFAGDHRVVHGHSDAKWSVDN